MDSNEKKHEDQICRQSSDEEVFLDTESQKNESSKNQSNHEVAADETPEKGLQSTHTSVSLYVARAATMRCRIEEKINEIEEKIKTSNLDTSTESIESVPSPMDYNLITVQDVKRSRSCSVTEMRQNTIDRLQSKLEKAEKELELKEGEVSRLRKIRDEVGYEIEDLTASLFEEANNMVRAAQVKQHKAEKQAKESNMKLTMLQDEVKALKTIVESSKLYSLPPAGEVKIVNPPPRETYEVDPIFHEEFVRWRQQPTLDRTNPFIKRIFEEDFEPCLNFKNSDLSKLLLEAIQEDSVTLENITLSKKEPLPKHCALLDAPRLCTHILSFGQSCYYISTLGRNRIASVCDLLCYFRYIQKGLITLRIHEVYLEVLKKRRKITSAKLGLIDDVV